MTPESIAHYRITAKIGEGGMGAVYRATDTKLNREVAIKVVPELLAESPDRMLRFTREAHVLASLNHPNIAAIYGVEERALVMELVEGHTLAGPLTLEEALPLIYQLIDALEYAHEKGIVHRDLKPANIMVTPEGRVKVLDFGLAKALANEAEPAASSPLAVRATMAGMIVGSAAYMSPEQARGQTIDRRSDIWAFGVLVWEMFAGRRLFQADSASETMAAVLRSDPDLEAAPPRVRRLLRLCLTRDPRQRLRDISGARLLLEEAPEAAPPIVPAPVIAPAPRPPKRLPWIFAAALAIVAAALGIGLWRATRPVARPLVRLSVDLGAEAVLSDYLTAAISPDGRRLAYVAHGPAGNLQLATRLLEDANPTLLNGTEDAAVPFFSPDGEWIGFFAAGKLKKVSVRGGAAVPLCDAPYARGASWGPGGSIVFAYTILGGLQRVSENGGAPQAVTDPATQGEQSHRWPQFLPGGQSVLFTGHTQGAGWDAASIEVLNLNTGKWKVVVKGGYFARYLPTGHIVYLSRGMLYAVPFDVARLETRGPPVPLVPDIGSAPISGGGQYDVSQTGTLVYLKGRPQSPDTPFVWMDASGKMQPLLSVPGTHYDPRLSPDGKRLTVSGVNGVLIYDIARATQSTLSTPGKMTARPLWTPDAEHIAYMGTTTGAATTIFWVRSDGTGAPFALLEPSNNRTPSSFSPDGKLLAFASEDERTHLDIWTVSLDLTDPDHPKAGPPEPFLRTPANEQFGVFSPNGRWIAYMSDEGGTSEIYVRPYPPGSGKWQISAGGGRSPVWSRASRELFFETPDNRIMVTAYRMEGAEFAAAKARLWSDVRLASTGAARNYDVAPDGRRLVIMPQPTDAGSVHVTFLLDFFDEVRRRVK